MNGTVWEQRFAASGPPEILNLAVIDIIRYPPRMGGTTPVYPPGSACGDISLDRKHLARRNRGRWHQIL